MASTGPDRAHSCRPRSFSRVSTVPITRLPMTRSSPCSAPPSNQPPTHRCPRKDDSPASRGSHQLATDNQNHGARAAIREPWRPGRNASEVTARTRTAIHNRSRRLFTAPRRTASPRTMSRRDPGPGGRVRVRLPRRRPGSGGLREMVRRSVAVILRDGLAETRHPRPADSCRTPPDIHPSGPATAAVPLRPWSGVPLLLRAKAP